MRRKGTTRATPRAASAPALLLWALTVSALFATSGFGFSFPSFLPRGTAAIVPGSKSPRGTIPNEYRILILPGFGNASEDYTMKGSLVNSFVQCGWDTKQISVLPVKRSDWLTVFVRGAFDLEFWCGKAAPTKPAFRWYLDSVANAVKRIEEQVKEEMGEATQPKIVLVGHSAGGWLARAAVGFCAETPDGENKQGISSMNVDDIVGIVTLGAPNLSPPPGALDMTRGALRITNERFPGSYYAPSKFYITVIGNAVVGKEQKRKSPFEPTTVDGFAYQSYLAVCGDGNTIGDGVVPLCAAHVDGSTQLVLDGIFHSINVPDRWYGSPGVINQWHNTVLDEITKRSKKNVRRSLWASTKLK